MTIQSHFIQPHLVDLIRQIAVFEKNIQTECQNPDVLEKLKALGDFYTRFASINPQNMQFVEAEGLYASLIDEAVEKLSQAIAFLQAEADGECDHQASCQFAGDAHFYSAFLIIMTETTDQFFDVTEDVLGLLSQITDRPFSESQKSYVNNMLLRLDELEARLKVAKLRFTEPVVEVALQL